MLLTALVKRRTDTHLSAAKQLLTNDKYLPGALTLVRALRNNGTKHKIVVLVTVENVSKDTLTKLKSTFTDLIPIPTLTNPDLTHLLVMGRQDLASTFTKLQIFSLTTYRKLIYLDADTLPLRSLDHLFTTTKTRFAAAPELGFPDCFNSGVMVFEPDARVFADLKEMAGKGESFDGGDQGLLNLYFAGWEKLSFMYNMELYKTYRLYMPAINKFKDNMAIIHFIGKTKPWNMDPKDALVDDSAYSMMYGEMIKKWWEVYETVGAKVNGTVDGKVSGKVGGS